MEISLVQVGLNGKKKFLYVKQKPCFNFVSLYEVKFKNFLYEIDVFSGENEGLILAEIELNSENQYFEKPSWIGQEVTGQKEYYNSYLSKYPFKKSN